MAFASNFSWHIPVYINPIFNKKYQIVLTRSNFKPEPGCLIEDSPHYGAKTHLGWYFLNFYKIFQIVHDILKSVIKMKFIILNGHVVDLRAFVWRKVEPQIASL